MARDCLGEGALRFFLEPDGWVGFRRGEAALLFSSSLSSNKSSVFTEGTKKMPSLHLQHTFSATLFPLPQVLGDHIYKSTNEDGRSCVQQMIEASKTWCSDGTSLLGLTTSAIEDVSSFGTVSGTCNSVVVQVEVETACCGC